MSSSLLDRFTDGHIARWAVGYLAFAWIAIQVLQVFWEIFAWPLWVLRAVVVLLGLAFPVVVGAAWIRRGRTRPTGRATDDAPREGAAATSGRRRLRAGAAAALVLLLLAAVGWSVRTGYVRQWARGEALLELSRLADAGEYAVAMDLAERVRPHLPSSAVVDSLMDVVSETVELTSSPEGAEVWVRPYAGEDDDWVLLGRTPLATRVPRGYKRWRIEAPGRLTLERAAGVLNGQIELPSEGAVPAGMVPVPGGRTLAWLTGLDPIIFSDSMATFHIGRHEVTNREYQAFVDSGGYSRPELWRHPFVDAAGGQVSRSSAMERFRDRSGLPGPATWRLGTHREGEADHPVTGVSWYEAAAFAEFAGASLPTVHHWIMAAVTSDGREIIPRSNFGEALAPVGSHGGMSRWGAYDMAGNAREWIWNEDAGGRYVLGGAWSDPTYFFSFANVQPPMQRDPGTGFRLARYQDPAALDGPLGAPVPLLPRREAREPIGDEIYAAYRAQFSYDTAPLNPAVEADERIDGGSIRIRKVSFDGAYGQRVAVWIATPAAGDGPFPPVILYPGSSAIFWQDSRGPFLNHLQSRRWILRTGRAMVFPVLWGTMERNEGIRSTWPSPTRAHAEQVRRWIQDIRRAIDLVETLPELDAARVGYLGLSWGARMGSILPAIEPRIRVAILASGGIASGVAPPEADQINYAPRVRVPVLMLNGRHDAVQPVAEAQRPLFELLGTPDAHKRHVVYETAGHGGFPPDDALREMLQWLDRYQGSAGRPPTVAQPPRW